MKSQKFLYNLKILIRVVEKFHNKTALADSFHKTETNVELIFQQLYFQIKFLSGILGELKKGCLYFNIIKLNFIELMD